MKSLHVCCDHCGASFDVEVPKNSWGGRRIKKASWGGRRAGAGRKKTKNQDELDFRRNQDELDFKSNKNIEDRLNQVILISEKNQDDLKKNIEKNMTETRARLSDLQRRPATNGREKREVIPPLEHPSGNGELTPREREELARMKAKHKGAGPP